MEILGYFLVAFAGSCVLSAVALAAFLISLRHRNRPGIAVTLSAALATIISISALILFYRFFGTAAFGTPTIALVAACLAMAIPVLVRAFRR